MSKKKKIVEVVEDGDFVAIMLDKKTAAQLLWQIGKNSGREEVGINPIYWALNKINDVVKLRREFSEIHSPTAHPRGGFLWEKKHDEV